MRKFVVILLIVIILIFSACSYISGMTKTLDKEGVAPYELTESNINLLTSLGLEKSTNIISLKAPKQAESLKVNVYRLSDDKTWKVIGDGQVSLGQDAPVNNRLEGTFAMLLKANYAIDFNINTKGRASYQTDELNYDDEVGVSSYVFLSEFQKIEINKEIPVAIMIYDNGTVIKNYTLQDFFSPSEFEGMGLVQAVTLVFSDTAN